MFRSELFGLQPRLAALMKPFEHFGRVRGVPHAMQYSGGYDCGLRIVGPLGEEYVGGTLWFVRKKKGKK